MTVVATTPRLILRRWTLDDAVAVAPIYGDAQTMRYFGDGSVFTPAQVAASFPGLIAEYAACGYGNYAVIERAGGAIVGHCGVRYIAGRARNEADWLLDRRYWGRGYGFEAASAVFERCFNEHGVPEIVGVAHRDNAASIALMQRLRMKLRETLTAHGVPSVLYTLAHADYGTGNLNPESAE